MRLPFPAYRAIAARTASDLHHQKLYYSTCILSGTYMQEPKFGPRNEKQKEGLSACQRRRFSSRCACNQSTRTRGGKKVSGARKRQEEPNTNLPSSSSIIVIIMVPTRLNGSKKAQNHRRGQPALSRMALLTQTMTGDFRESKQTSCGF